VRPEWEDAQNKHGGKWSYQFKDDGAVNSEELGLQTQLGTMGEILEDEDGKKFMGRGLQPTKGLAKTWWWTRKVGKSRKDSLNKESL
jgi:translation initiation factor 4E